MIWRRDKSSPSGRICSTEGRPIQERRRILIARFKEVAMRWKCPGSVPTEMLSLNLVCEVAGRRRGSNELILSYATRRNF